MHASGVTSATGGPSNEPAGPARRILLPIFLVSALAGIDGLYLLLYNNAIRQAEQEETHILPKLTAPTLGSIPDGGLAGSAQARRRLMRPVPPPGVSVALCGRSLSPSMIGLFEYLKLELSPAFADSLLTLNHRADPIGIRCAYPNDATFRRKRPCDSPPDRKRGADRRLNRRSPIPRLSPEFWFRELSLWIAAAGTLDDPAAFRPTIEICCETALPWVHGATSSRGCGLRSIDCWCAALEYCYTTARAGGDPRTLWPRNVSRPGRSCR